MDVFPHGSALMPARPARPLARLAVTVALPVLVGLAGRVPLPGVGPAPHLFGGTGVLALGLGPFVTSFVLVELAALTVPRWRPLRVGGPTGRAPLEVASVALGLLLALVQGHGMSRFLQSNGALPGGLGAGLLATLTLAAGSGALMWVASLIGRHGLGNGFAVLLAARTISVPVWEIPEMQLVIDGRAGPLPTTVAILVYGTLAVAVVGMLLANDRAAAAGLDGVRLRDPASGLVPISWATTLLLLPATLAGWSPALGKLAETLAARTTSAARTTLFDGLLLAATLSLGVLLSRLFHRPRQVSAVWSRIEGAPSDATTLEGQAAAALHVARVRSALLLAVFVLLPTVPRAAGHPLLVSSWTGLGLAFGLAAVADVMGEWRARRTLGGLVSVWPEHRLYAVDAALEALRRARIQAFARGVHYRTLGQFFAPYVPVEIMVPAHRATQALPILRHVLLGEDRAPRPDRATGQLTATSPSPPGAAK